MTLLWSIFHRLLSRSAPRASETSSRTQTMAADSYDEKSGELDQVGNNGVGGNAHYDDDDGAVVCPPHTTERRLLTKIDFRVVPFLCIMYTLAFLGWFPKSVHATSRRPWKLTAVQIV